MASRRCYLCLSIPANSEGRPAAPGGHRRTLSRNGNDAPAVRSHHADAVVPKRRAGRFAAGRLTHTSLNQPRLPRNR
jgi:hypothetical protein